MIENYKDELEFLREPSDEMIEKIAKKFPTFDNISEERIEKLFAQKMQLPVNDDKEHETESGEAFMKSNKKSNPLLRRILVSAASIVVIFGVGAAAYSGISKMNSKNTTANIMVDRVSLTEMYSAAENICGKKYGNLTMPQTISLDKTDTLFTVNCGECKALSPEEQKKRIALIAKELYGIDVKEEYFQKYGTDDIPYLDYADGRYFISADTDFGFAAEDNVLFDEPKQYESNAELIRLDRNEDTTAEYELIGGKCSVSDALKFADSQVEKAKKYISPEEELRPKTVIVTKLSNGKYIYRFIYEKIWNGIALDEGCDTIMGHSGVISPSYVEFAVDAPEHLNGICVCYPKHYEGTPEVCEDSFIPLSKAAELLSDYIAEYNKFEVTDIDIKYGYVTCYEKISESVSIFKDGEMRPMWVFVLREKLDEGMSVWHSDLRTCGYVDMITGKCYVVDSIEHNIYFDISEKE